MKLNGRVVRAWAVILLMVGLIYYAQNHTNKNEPKIDIKVQHHIMDLQTRLIWVLARHDTKTLERIPASGAVRERLCFAVMKGDVLSDEKALEELKSLEELADKHQQNFTERQKKVVVELKKFYSSKDENKAFQLKKNHEMLFTEELGWFSHLCFYPKGSAGEERKTLVAHAEKQLSQLLSLGFLMLVCGVAGIASWILFINNFNRGKSKFTLKAEGAPRHYIYAETFALWLVTFCVLAFFIREFVALPSLVVMLWPRLRGLSWRDIKQDLGLHVGKGWYEELVAGLRTYVQILPALVVATIVLFFLMGLFSTSGGGGPFDSSEGMGHPMANDFVGASWSQLLKYLFLLSVSAPIVEEIMFRGVLLRHLREAVVPWGKIISVLFPALLTSFVFAVIHPQGVMAVPILMSIALVLNFAREWRSSLISCMVAHAIHNAVSFAFIVCILN